MALLWQESRHGLRHEVRTAGRTVRLYTNGVCHSEYNPRRPVTGSYIDLLFLPALFRPPGEIRRVLVLGVGGGTIIRLLHDHLRPEAIVGVEHNLSHLRIARRFFGLDDLDFDLRIADAAWWVRERREGRYDLIIDDLFSDACGEPRRAVVADTGWFTALRRLLNPGGVLVIDFPDMGDFRRCGFMTRRTAAAGFRSAFILRRPHLDNAVLACVRGMATTRALRRRLNALTPLRRALGSGLLRYTIRRVISD